ncbi:ribonuclease K3-like [Octodon degus]|uniref:Ribonuclease K6 n=1 Tax=Octodon degus TaxID=10160 RepID=A0A6P3FYD6_OCTDE|nr:ribonuclease K3-like [Octodon degus]XP_023564124.1 ribonuclease K3-like [Octodon degus]
MVRVLRSLLLLLLGLLGLPCSLWALTPFQKFKIQHVQSNPQSCDQDMIAVNNLDKTCKATNTFLHDDLQNVIDVCKLRATRCKHGQYNCHQSATPVRMTKCSLKKPSQFPNCHYRDAHITKNFIVACDPPQPSDPPYPRVPVHFDRIVESFDQFCLS